MRAVGLAGLPHPYRAGEGCSLTVEIDSISLNPDTVIKTRLKIAEKEKELGVSPEK